MPDRMHNKYERVATKMVPYCITGRMLLSEFCLDTLQAVETPSSGPFVLAPGWSRNRRGGGIQAGSGGEVYRERLVSTRNAHSRFSLPRLATMQVVFGSVRRRRTAERDTPP